MMLGEVTRATRERRRQVIVASHNEASVTRAASTVTRLGLNPTSGDVVFGQVYGMAENISIPLGESCVGISLVHYNCKYTLKNASK